MARRYFVRGVLRARGSGGIGVAASSDPASALFVLPLNKLDSPPTEVAPGKYKDLNVLETEHIESWLESVPQILGEELLVIGSQFAKFDKSNKRLDILALDRAGQLVVVEVKRDSSGTDQEIQALHYAAYCSTFKLEDVVEIYAQATYGQIGDEALEKARQALPDFAIEGSLEGFDEDSQVRIMLLARSFRPEVTATVLWLIETWGLDISCVELVPYERNGELLLSASKRIPLPNAEDFQIKKAAKQKSAGSSGKHISWQVAMQVMAAIPKGHWMSYQDLAVAAGGSERAGMAMGQYLAKSQDLLPNCVHRVLRGNGTISPQWSGEIGGPEDARALLKKEGLKFIKGAADPARRWFPSQEEIG